MPEVADFASQLDENSPQGTDQYSTVDEQLRLLKHVVLNQLGGLGNEKIEVAAGLINAITKIFDDGQARDISSVLTLQGNGVIDFNRKPARNAKLTKYSTPHTVVVPASGVLTLNLATGSSFEVVMSGSISSIVFQNWPPAGELGEVVLFTKGAGVATSITWPGSVRWTGGITPAAPTQTANKYDVYVLISNDGGSNIFGALYSRNA